MYLMLLFNLSQTRIKRFLFLFPFYKGLIFVLLFCIFLGACSSKSDSDSSNTVFSDAGSSNDVNMAITAGLAHTCAILKDGSVKCWGDNTSGKTGGGTPDLGGKTATHIAAGLNHTCAILNDGDVKCWGANGSGQIGGGVLNDKRTRILSGTKGSPLSGQTAIHISAGGYHTCSILKDDGVKCWGDTGSGQTGIGLFTLGRKNITYITGGTEHNCAILKDSSIRCMGRYVSGQIGGGIGHSTRTIMGKEGNPLGNQTVIHIAAGNRHTCAILKDSSVKCWGRNDFGQTGGGTQNSKNSRTLIGTAGDPLNGQTATALAAGIDHTCAILTDKSVKCWGDNNLGQTGGGSKKSSNTRTIIGTQGDPLSGETVTAIAAGNNHACAILSDDSIKCWGSNDFGQTGGGSPLPFDKNP